MKRVILAALVLSLSACSVTRLPEDMGYGVLNNNDLETVRDGLPTYLLMIDGALLTYPKSTGLLLTASSLNSAYSGVFVQDEARKLKMTVKAFDLAKRALCEYKKDACDVVKMPFDDFETLIGGMNKKKDLPFLYGVASAWTSHIQLTSSDYNSIAALGRVELMMKKVVEVQDDYEYGMPYVYLGALNSLVPPSLGGKPDVAKTYFEKSVAVSDGKNLIAKVMYADKYGRLMFEQELHDRLLTEVLDSPSEVHGLTLQNEYAKQEAKRLLEDGKDYF